MRIAVIEDEPVYAEELTGLIKMCSGEDQKEVRWFASGEALLASDWQGKEYDLIFLDIELKGKNGLETAKFLRNNGYTGVLVFTTNYQQFVYEGYEVEAFRYLLKPLKHADVEACLEKVRQISNRRSLKFSLRRQQYSISYEEIIYISSYGHYVTVHTKNEDYEWKCLLKDLQPQLPVQFIRCHRSFIVNLDYFRKLERSRMYLKNGEVVDVAAGYLESVRGAVARML